MTGAARRMLGLIAVATALIVVAAVLVWRAVARPPTSIEASTPGQDNGAGAERAGTASAPRPSGSAVAGTTGAPSVAAAPAVAPAKREMLPQVMNEKAARAARAAAILAPPAPPQGPPPPKPAEVAIRTKLSQVLERHAGTDLSFVTCDSETPPCRAQVQARDLASVAAAARDASAQYQGHVNIVLHEKITGFNGRYFVAEMEVGTPDTKPVPTDLEPLR